MDIEIGIDTQIFRYIYSKYDFDQKIKNRKAFSKNPENTNVLKIFQFSRFDFPDFTS